MKTLNHVDWNSLGGNGLPFNVRIVSSRLEGDKVLDVVFSSALTSSEGCLALHRIYEQLSGEPPCTIKSGYKYSLRLQYEGRHAIFEDHLVHNLRLPIGDSSHHHRLNLTEGYGDLARSFVTESH